MILNRLVEYYQRLVEEDDETPRFGFSVEKISFSLTLNPDGSFDPASFVTDLRESAGKKTVSRSLVVPKPARTRTSGVFPMPLWDKTSYVLGADDAAGTEKSRKHFEAFRDFHRELLAGCEDVGAKALLAFLDAWQPERAAEIVSQSFPWKDVSGANVVFKLADTAKFLHDRPVLRRLWEARRAAEGEDAMTGQCLVTGEVGPVATTHSAIKGVVDAQTSGAFIVSFNDNAYCSYGMSAKDQGRNAPVGSAAAFAYTTALNQLLRSGETNKQKITLGDASVVFWAQTQFEDEDKFGELITEPDSESENRLRTALQMIAQGVKPRDALQDIADDVRFFVLGLAAPGKARLTVRYWLERTLGDLLSSVADHYRVMAIEPRRVGEPPKAFGLWRILGELAVGGKRENVPGHLLTPMLRAVLTGGPYPDAVLSLALERIRHEHGDREPVSDVRIGLIKAYLTRKYPTKELTVSLNIEEREVSYCLGRLFAVLEKAQLDALPGIKATIKDRYFSSASATPRAIFPVLLRLAQHHMAKDEYGKVKDRVIGEIMELLPGTENFPTRLTMEQQGRFAIGYYHQRNALYRKSEKPQSSESQE